jgi:hypothetical protein
MANESGITALGPEDIENNVEGTEQKESAFPQFTDEAKRQRGIEGFKSFKKGFKQALPYIGQLGLDLVPGSGITEIFGKQVDIVEGGQRPSFAGQVERTTELAKEGKTTEAVVSGVDTALTGVAGVGEGIMVAGALTGPLAPLLVGAGFAIKGLAKGGKLILQSTKTGKKILANYEGNKNEGFNVTNLEIPKDVETDPDIQTLEDTIDVPTTKTDDTDTEVAIETDNVVDKFYPNLKNKEIKEEGGFDWKTIDDPIKQSDVRLNRHIKRLEGVSKGEDYVGGPVNKRTVLKSDNPDNPDVVIGKQTFDDWKNTKIKQFKNNKDEIFEASKWYDNYVKEVKSIPNITKEEADTLIEASFAANINQSPEAALKTVLDVKEQLQKGISLNDVKIKGVPIIRESLKTVVGKQKGGRGSGIGSKISAFVDNAKDKNVRSDMGNDPRGGEPVTIDLQTLRSKGAVDNIYKNKLKTLGYKKEDGSDIDDIKIDFEKSGTQEAKYDYFAFEMNQLTNHLNEINWLGKNNWKAKEVQAIDWLGQQKIFGKALPVEDIFNVNIQNITMEAAPSPSSPLGKKMLSRYKALSTTDQQSINDDITKKAVDIVAEKEGEDLGNVIFGTGGWMRDVNPTTVKQSLMTHDKAKKVAAKLGELLQQDQVWVNTTKGGYTKNPDNHEIVIIEENTNNLQNNEKIFELFDKIIKKKGGDMIQGFHPITTSR